MSRRRPVSFTTFATRTLNLTLTRGQRVLARVAFDGLEPSQLDPAERELAREMFGGVDEVPRDARRILVLLLGRASGKTTLSAAYALYAALTADLSRCGPGDVPVAVTLAPDKRTAGLAIRMALEMVRASRDIARMLESETAEGFTLRRPDGRLVAVEAFAAARGGASARGRTILTFILDEAQFFRSADAVVNDRDVYGALIPRLLPGGRAIFISTPWPTETLMGELYTRNLGAPSTALAARAPTLVMRDDDPDIAKLVDEERRRDAGNAAREFDVDTTFRGAGMFFDGGAIAANIEDAALPASALDASAVAAGADFAFRSDSSALVVAATTRDVHRTLHLVELRPTREKPLEPGLVVANFARELLSYGITRITADNHYSESIREHLTRHKMELLPAPAGITGKAATYVRARTLLHDGLVRLPNHPRFLAQLRSITSTPTPGGGLSIVAPRRAGTGHGDIVSAWVLALWSVATFGKAADPPPPELRGADFWGANTSHGMYWDGVLRQAFGPHAIPEGASGGSFMSGF